MDEYHLGFNSGRSLEQLLWMLESISERIAEQ